MGLFKTAAKVAVASSVHGRVQRRQQQRWAAQDAAQARPAAPVPPAPSAPSAPTAPAAPAEYGRPHFATGHPGSDGPPVGHAPAPRPSVARVDMATKLAQLQQLGDLRASGVLTDAEFEGQKAAILAQ